MKNNPRKIQNLIVHHSLGHWGDDNYIKRIHCGPKEEGYHGWTNPGYHCVIGNGFPTYNSFKSGTRLPEFDGTVYRILSEDKIANGVRGANSNSLHVCLIGDLDKYQMTRNQRIKLVDLLTHWCAEYELEPRECVLGHGEAQRKLLRQAHAKSCPGVFADMPHVREGVSFRLK